jgi:hypothetical protein
MFIIELYTEITETLSQRSKSGRPIFSEYASASLTYKKFPPSFEPMALFQCFRFSCVLTDGPLNVYWVSDVNSRGRDNLKSRNGRTDISELKGLMHEPVTCRKQFCREKEHLKNSCFQLLKCNFQNENVNLSWPHSTHFCTKQCREFV